MHGERASPHSDDDVAVPGSDEFRRRYRRLVLATWIFPVLIGDALEVFLGLISIRDLFLTIFAGFTGPFILAFLVFATRFLDRRAAAITEIVEARSDSPGTAARIEPAVRRLLALHIVLFIFFSIAGPQTTLLTFHVLHVPSEEAATAGNLLIGMLPPILLIALPLFFLVTDLFGAYLAPRGVLLDIAPLRLKYAVLGLISPALVDITLLLYFKDRTGYLTLETFAVWGSLLLVSAVATALAWRSIKQGLAPLRHNVLMLERSDRETDPDTRPRSLDELGQLAHDWNRLLKQRRILESRFRDLVEGSIQGIFVHRDFKPIFANQALADMLGYDSPADILALPSVMDFVHPDEHARTTEYKELRLAGKDAPKRYEFRAVRRDGREIWLENSSRAVDWEGGRVIQGAVVDITNRKRAEESLLQSEGRFRDLVEGSIQGIFVLQGFRIVFANRTLVDMLGYDSVEKICALDDPTLLVAPEDRHRIMDYARARREGRPAPDRYELKALRADGSELWQEAMVRPVKWNGEPALQITVVDISERKSAELSLIESESNLRNAQRIARIGSFEHDLMSGQLNWSEQVFDIFGIAVEQGIPSHDEFMALVNPEDRARVAATAETMMRERGKCRIDFRILRRDGELRHIHMEAETAVDMTGAPEVMKGTIQDVTSLRRTEAALESSEESLRRAQRIARLGNWDRDLSSDRLYWSDEMYRLFGFSRDSEPEPSVELFLQRVHPDDRDAIRQAIEEARSGGAPYDMDFRVHLPDGTDRIVHAQGELALNERGEPVRFAGVAQDVTRLRKAEAEVRRLNAELEKRVEERTAELKVAQFELIKKSRLAVLGQLTATVSHELRNPLAAMRTSAYVLGKTLGETETPATKAIARIERGIARCDRIIDELLDFTRSTQISREAVTIDRWLGSLLKEMEVPAGMRLDFKPGLRGRIAMFDSGRMRRAVINIVENAFQAIVESDQPSTSLDDGRVAVVTELRNGQVEIIVSDNGPGIADDIRERIFEPLFSTKTFGVGLGLPTVRQILEQHGGSLVLESEPGAGTTFRLTFPLEQPDPDERNGAGGTVGVSG